MNSVNITIADYKSSYDVVIVLAGATADVSPVNSSVVVTPAVGPGGDPLPPAINAEDEVPPDAPELKAFAKEGLVEKLVPSYPKTAVVLVVPLLPPACIESV